MRDDGRRRAAPLWAAGTFLVMAILGECVAFSLVSKRITWRRGGPMEVALSWEAFLLFSAVGLAFSCWCAYRTWRVRAGAASRDEAAS